MFRSLQSIQFSLKAPMDPALDQKPPIDPIQKKFSMAILVIETSIGAVHVNPLVAEARKRQSSHHAVRKLVSKQWREPEGRIDID